MRLPWKNKRKQKHQHYRLSLKGMALIAAVETGLLPANEDGAYDDELFGRFWDYFMWLLTERTDAPAGKRAR